MRIIENGHRLISVPFDESLPSVNEPDEAEIAINYEKQSHSANAFITNICIELS